MVKFTHDLNGRFVISRNEPFKSRDSNLVKRFIEKIIKIDETQFYAEALYDICLEKSICEELPSQIHKISETIMDIFTTWSLRTYEGRHPSFGIIVDISSYIKNKESNLHIENFMKKDYAAPLSDGISSYIRISSDGYVMSHETLNNSTEGETYAPYRFMNFANKCENDNIGFVLLPNGEVLLFSKKEMIYAKRQGKWKLFDHSTAIMRLSDGSKYMIEDIRKAMYLTALDVSFSKTGGCIGYINKTQKNEAYDLLNVGDRLLDNKKKNDKSELLYSLIKGVQFQRLSRKLRQELAGIDGATIIDDDGNLIACGTIIQNVESNNKGGGRLAATIQLSKYGTAIKISADGGISAYHKKKEIISIG